MTTPTLHHRVAYAHTVGARLKLARELAGLSLTQAANLLDLDTAVLDMLERMERRTGTPIPLAASVYGVSGAWLTLGTRNTPSVIRGLAKLEPDAQEHVAALLSVLSQGPDEPAPTSEHYVFEVREEWRTGRGRYWMPRGEGYTNRLSRAGLFGPEAAANLDTAKARAIPLDVVIAELDVARTALLDKRASEAALAALPDDAEVAAPPVSVPAIPTTLAAQD